VRWFGRFFRAFSTPLPAVVDTSWLNTLSVDLLGVPAIVRAVQLISGDSARLDLVVTRRDGSVVDGSPVLELLRGDSTGFLSGLELRRWLACSALTFGNGYAYIRRDMSTGEPIGLDPIDSNSVSVSIGANGPAYTVDQQPIDASFILHVRASTDPVNPWLGVSPIALCSRVLGTQAILDQVAEQLAKTGMVGKVAIEHPGPLTPTARAGMRSAWVDQHVGAEFTGIPAFFGEGMKVSQMAADAASRLLEAKRQGVEEVARAFGVPTQLLYQGEGRSQSEVAQAYTTHCLAPFCASIDAELTRKLLPMGQRIAHDLTPMTQGDYREAGRAYAQLVQVGVLAPNDVRRRIGLPPIAGMDTPAPVLSGVTPMQDQQQGAGNGP
jgi:hypothetical protein